MPASSRICTLRARAIAIVAAVSMFIAVSSCRQTDRPSPSLDLSSIPRPKPAADVQDGYATLTLVVTEVTGRDVERNRENLGGAFFERPLVLKLPLTGAEVEVQNGPRIPFQTVANNMVTTGFQSGGLTVRAKATAGLVQNQPRIQVALVVEDAHVLQQVDMPIRLTKAPMIDVTRLTGTLVMANHVEQRVARYQRHGANPVEWTLSGRLDWISLPAAPATIPDSARRVDLHVSMGHPLRPIEEFETDMAIVPGDKSDVATLARGRQAPVETLANNTSTITYKGSGSSIQWWWRGAGPEMSVTNTRFITTSDNIDAPQLYEDGFSSQLFSLNPTGITQPVEVARIMTASVLTALRVERLRVTPLAGAP